MKSSKFSLLFLLTGTFLFSQNQKFTLAESVNGLRSTLAVKNISQFSWSDDSKIFLSRREKCLFDYGSS